MSGARYATLVAAAFFILWSRGATAAGASAGEVLAMGGQCFVEAAGQRTALKLGDTVHVGDTVDVPAGAKLKLRMTDGSIIAAAPGSRVTIETYDVKGSDSRDAKLSLASGLLRAIVSATGPQSRFEVDTATGIAGVRSTDWFIEFRPGSTQVGVLSGVVSLTSTATMKSVRIPARWGARVETGRDPVQARVWTEAEFDDVIARTALDTK